VFSSCAKFAELGQLWRKASMTRSDGAVALFLDQDLGLADPQLSILAATSSPLPGFVLIRLLAGRE